MGKVDLGELMSTTQMGAFRTIFGLKCSTEQGIRSQIREVEAGEKKPADVGFEVIRHGNTVFLKQTEPELKDLWAKMNGWVAENKPNVSKKA